MEPNKIKKIKKLLLLKTNYHKIWQRKLLSKLHKNCSPYITAILTTLIWYQLSWLLKHYVMTKAFHYDVLNKWLNLVLVCHIPAPIVNLCRWHSKCLTNTICFIQLTQYEMFLSKLTTILIFCYIIHSFGHKNCWVFVHKING